MSASNSLSAGRPTVARPGAGVVPAPGVWDDRQVLSREVVQRARPARDTRARADAITQTAPPAAGVLSMQATVGNAVVSRLLSAGGSGPALMRNGWAYKPVTEVKQRLDRGSRWGAGTLHHHISQYRLNMLAEQIELGRKSKDRDIRRLVQQVENRVDEALNYLLVNVLKGRPIELGAPIDTKLHNLPMNLHYGPSLVANNPGIGFDPSTVRGEGGTRVVDPVSRHLRQLDAEISKVSDLNEGAVLAADVWENIAKHLGDAFDAYVTSKDIFEETSDQWMEGAGEAWHKKGELTLKDVRHARPLFAGGATPEVQQGAALEVQVNKVLQLDDGGVANVLIGARQKAVTHFCNRHTYAHFDRTKIKGVNIFWPAGTTRATVIANLRRAIDAAWAHITNEIGTDFESYEVTEKLVKVIGSDGLKRTDQAMYYRVFVPSDPLVLNGNADAELEVDMLAPTGTAYDAYEGSVLEQVFG